MSGLRTFEKEWKLVAKLGENGHRVFLHHPSGRHAIADDSGRLPPATEGGVLWLPKKGKLVVACKSDGDDYVILKVIEEDGGESHTLLNSYEAFRLAEILPDRFSVSLDTGEKRYDVVPVACCPCGTPLDEPCLKCFPDGDDPTPGVRNRMREVQSYMPSWEEWFDRWHFCQTGPDGTYVKQSHRAFDLTDAGDLPDGVYHMAYDCEMAYQTLEWVAADARLAHNPQVPAHRRKGFDPGGKCASLAYKWLLAMGLPQAKLFAPASA